MELVTQPGRMYQLKKGTIPQLSNEALWGQEGTPGVETGAVHEPHEQASASGYPTMPNPAEPVCSSVFMLFALKGTSELSRTLSELLRLSSDFLCNV